MMGGRHPGAADTTAARAATITVVKETMMLDWCLAEEVAVCGGKAG